MIFSPSSEPVVNFLTTAPANLQLNYRELVAVGKHQLLNVTTVSENCAPLKIPEKSRDLKKVVRTALGNMCGNNLLNNLYIAYQIFL